MTPTNPSRNDRIVNAAQIYQQNLCDQTVLFVYGKPSSPQTVEVEFKAGNFCHLVGVEPRRDGLMRMKASELYSRAIEGALHSGNYGFSRGQDYCDLKLEVIGRIVRIDTNARMIGDFEDGRFVNLSTDKVVGRQNAVLGLVETGDVFVPNSVINADIREIARSASQVLATFKDPTLNSVKCSTVRYV
ncbi:MAG: PBECR4 domain-containing protein, partial [Raoultibacter sp.]